MSYVSDARPLLARETRLEALLRWVESDPEAYTLDVLL